MQNEDEINVIKSMPFRNYLLQYVVPTLNEGLVEVANNLPEDPVDFLVTILI
jgi:adenylate kinase